MKVLSLCYLKPDKFGGFERYLIGFSEFLKSKGHEHHIWFCCEPVDEVKALLIKHGASYRVIAFRQLDWLYSISLFNEIRHEGFDIAHIHFHTTYSFLAFLLSFTRTGLFYTFHISGAPTEAFRLKNMLKSIRAKVLGRGIDSVFCVSEYTQNKFIINYQEQREKTQVIYNGLNLDIYHSGLEKDNNQSVTLIVVGYIIEEKGFQNLLSSAVLLKDQNFRIQIVGEGPYKTELQNMVSTLGLSDKVQFLGQRNDVPELLSKADIAVVPSIWQEACAYTVIESTAAGLPLVVTSVGGNPELVEDGVNGYIVKPADHDDLADRLKTLINDPKLRLKMGKKSWEKALQDFNVERVYQQQMAAFEKSMQV